MKGTAFLRLFDHRGDTAKNLAALLGAEDVGRMSKNAIGAAMTRRKDLFQGEIPNITDLLEGERAKGMAEGMRATLVRLLERRFGPLPADVRAKIEAAGERQLEAWTDAVLDARTLKAVLQAGSRRRAGKPRA